MSPGGMKYDSGKPRPTLLFRGLAHGISLIIKVLDYGAKKYKPDSWQTVPNAEVRYQDALLRHVLAWQGGEVVDDESKLPHLAHIACNALFLLELQKDNSNGSSTVSPTFPILNNDSFKQFDGTLRFPEFSTNPAGTGLPVGKVHQAGGSWSDALRDAGRETTLAAGSAC